MIPERAQYGLDEDTQTPMLDAVIQTTWGVVYLDLEMGFAHDPTSPTNVRDVIESISRLADIELPQLQKKKCRSEIEVQIALANIARRSGIF